MAGKGAKKPRNMDSYYVSVKLLKLRHFAKGKIQIQMLLHHLQDDYFTTKSFDELMPYPP